MNKQRLALGLDLSTQSLSAVVIDIDSKKKVFEHSLDYLKDERLNDFGIQKADYLAPARTEGEADQPPKMFLAGIDAMFSDMQGAGFALGNIVVVNGSGQQHGHVYLNRTAKTAFSALKKGASSSSNLVNLLGVSFAYGLAPIWMTSNTSEQASALRDYVGGKENLIRLSGSDSPLRFTGVVMRRIAQQFPGAYEDTENIQLISSLIPAVLTGDSLVPIDYGNGSGMSLMDYTGKCWSEFLIEALSDGLPGGAVAFKGKLPPLVPPDTIVGKIASYFVMKYGFNPDCAIVAGSGDNPQSKVLVSGDLLSLGSSLVNMVSTDGRTFDLEGFANSMYDGVGRPFLLGCRTNGALVWDRVRTDYGIAKDDYESSERALQQVPLGRNMVFWQPRGESFPPSGSFDLVRVGNTEPDFTSDYAGVLESSLAAVYYHSRNYTKETAESLYITGGAANSRETVRRIAAIWNRPVIVLDDSGAALGAAIAGSCAFLRSMGTETDVDDYSAGIANRGEHIQPRREDVAAIHGPRGYLDRFAVEELRVIKAHFDH